MKYSFAAFGKQWAIISEEAFAERNDAIVLIRMFFR